jgi:hypothetical protein
MSQHFFDLIRKGKTTEITEALEAQPFLAKSRGFPDHPRRSSRSPTPTA